MKRQDKLLEILLKANKPHTTKDLAEKLNVSSRTIRTDLDLIETKIIKYNMTLEKKPKVGVWIEGSASNKDSLFLNLTGKDDFELTYSKEYRRACMLMLILLGNNKIYLNKFSEMFYVSHSTIVKDISEVEKWLEEHGLHLEKKDNDGIYINTKNEECLRNAISWMAGYLNSMGLSIENVLNKYLYIDLNSIKNIVSQWNIKNNIHLNDINVENLSFHVCIMLIRIHKGKDIVLKKYKAIEVKNFAYGNQFKELIRQLEEKHDCEIPEDEADYLLMHLLGMILDSDLFFENEMLDELNKIVKCITEDFIDNLDKIVSLNLKENASFKESLMLHLLPTVYRLKFNLNLYNPLLNEIKLEYSNYYLLAQVINSSFKKYLGITASEEEIAFVALHLSTVAEQSKQEKEVAVVCSLGVGVSKFLIVKLRENFPNIQFIECSTSDKEKIRNKKYIISAVKLDFSDSYLLVNPLLNSLEIEKIRRYLFNDPAFDNKTFSLQSIIVEHEKISKLEVLTKLSSRLFMIGSVKSNFLESVLKRESLGSTEIGNGIVLTHGFYESVLKTKIGFLKLDEPIIWNEEEINLVVMLAIEEKDSKNILQMNWLYKLLNNDEFILRIKDSNNEKEIYSILEEARKKM